jgi:hypothetical protein
MITAFDDGSDEDIHCVELLRVEERAEDLAAALDQDVGHATTGELFKERDDWNATGLRKDDHFATVRSEH